MITRADTVSSVALTSATGALNNTLNAGDVVTATVTFNEAVTVTGTPRLALNIGGTTVQANYAAGSGSAELTFSYTILAAQTDTNGIAVAANALALNSGTIKDTAGNNATLTHALVADNAAYLVDTTAPALPTISAVATDDIISESEQTGAITGTAEAGASVALTLGAGNVHTVTANGSGNWTYSLTAADIAAMGQGAETISVTATDAAGNTSTAGTRAITVATILYSVSDAPQITEGGDAVFTVTRSGDTSAAGTVTYSTQGGTAVAGSDFTAVTGTLTFAAGETTKTVNVATLDDAIGERSEYFSLALVDSTNGVVNSQAAVGSATILDNELSVWSVASAGDVAENAGTLSFTVTRSGGTDAATIRFGTAGGTATPGADFTATSQVLSFAAGETSKTVTVAVATITRGNASAAATTYFRSNGGTATAGSDYTAIAAQTLSWGVGEATKVVFVSLLDDASAESTETLIGQIATNSGFSTGLATATVNLLDNDTAASGAVTYTITAVSSSSGEPDGMLYYEVKRSGDLTATSTSYARNTDTSAAQPRATPDVDYVYAGLQTLQWAAGESTKVLSTLLINDSVAEGTQNVTMYHSTSADLSTSLISAVPYIWDDDSFTTAAGVADVLTTGASATASGYDRLNTGDMGDSVTIGDQVSQYNIIDLGSGDDTLFTGTAPTAARFFSPGSQYAGGSGTDTLALQGTTAFNFPGLATAGNFIKGFEIVSMAATGNQTVNLSLQDVLEFTTGNAVADTLRITGTAGDILNLQALGKTMTTPVPATGNLIDVDGTAYDVVASAAGNASANDVVIGGQTYDVYQYQHSGHTVNLLVNTALTTNVI